MKVCYIEGTIDQEVQVEVEPGVFETVIESVGTGSGPVVGINRGPQEGESLINSEVTSFTEGYLSDRYVVQSFTLVVKDQEDLDAIDFQKDKDELQATFKTECTQEILKLYPEPIQRSAAIGVYPTTLVEEMATTIATYIGEENRVFDEVGAATHPAVLQNIKPFWRD